MPHVAGRGFGGLDECRLHTCLRLGDSHLIIGEVVTITARRDIVVYGHPDYGKAATDVVAGTG